MIRFAPLNTIAIAAVLALSAGVYRSFAEDSPFALFKLNAVETDCLVSRLARNGYALWGRDRVSAEGGAQITDAEAESAYRCALPGMAQAYAKSKIPAAMQFSTWRRFSTSPYASATHGNRYVSNYANPVAAPHYARYEQADSLPVGSIVAKDSIVVNQNGRVIFGSLALMEKMPAGFNPDGGDWRYTLVLPDGRQFGSTGGDGSSKVRFCQDCHQVAKQEQDSLFFVPKPYRAR